MAHYKRKGHRGRHKKNTMDNQRSRVVGNSVAKALYYGCNPWNVHQSASQRNRIEGAYA